MALSASKRFDHVLASSDLRTVLSVDQARQVYGCYWFEEYAPAHMLDKIPVDNILFETDYPHPVCLYGDVREKIEAGLGNADPEIRRLKNWNRRTIRSLS